MALVDIKPAITFKCLQLESGHSELRFPQPTTVPVNLLESMGFSHDLCSVIDCKIILPNFPSKPTLRDSDIPQIITSDNEGTSALFGLLNFL
jgi:hypothetical protein